MINVGSGKSSFSLLAKVNLVKVLGKYLSFAVIELKILSICRIAFKMKCRRLSRNRN